MTLKEYLDSLPDRLSRDHFAGRIGTTPGYLSHLANGRRNITVSLAINIERETSGALRCEDLCPDVDWAFIRGRKKAN